MAVGDLNGDGVAEVVVGMFSGVVSVYRNRGDGRLQRMRNYAATEDATSIAIGDLNGDSKPDLAVGDGAGDLGSVAVLLNRGGGTFGRAHLYRAGSEPEAVTIGDLDGDGKPDLVAVNLEDDSVSVMKNRGDGTFAAQLTYHTGSGPTVVAVGDLTGDGRLDVVTGNQGLDKNSVSLLANKGDGTLAAPRTHWLGQYSTDGVEVADLDGDGKPDLIASGYGDDGTDRVFVFHNVGGGRFDAPRKYPTAGGSGLAVADLNGDGYPDLATARVSVLINRGDGTFNPPQTYKSGGPGDYVAIGNLTADSRPDLVLASSLTLDGKVLASTSGH